MLKAPRTQGPVAPVTLCPSPPHVQAFSAIGGVMSPVFVSGLHREKASVLPGDS